MSDELAAARARRDALHEEIARIERDLATQPELRARRAEIEQALRDAERALERTRKRSLPLLSRVYVASPCDARWEDMKGDARARHCAACDKTVYDFSAMQAEDAEALLAAHGESLCAQFYRRADGTVLTADCRVGARRKMRRRVLAATTLALAAMGSGMLAHALLPERTAPRASCGLELRAAPPKPSTIHRAPPNRSSREPMIRGGLGLRVDPSPEERDA